jgi:hypothetical protein
LSKIIVQFVIVIYKNIRVLAHYLCTLLHLLGYSLEGEGQKDLTNVDGYLDLSEVQVQVIGQVLRSLDQKFQVSNHQYNLTEGHANFQNRIGT